ncbi:TRAP transporter permease [Aliicoccus persicus]|uniref:TRAP transporter, 4TM/12TM fusion protein n=1 Tax=Aliicoccus persicus TaxID=930138 RepID=A0A662Z8P9_9STAP|nr:TRAP transporter permease [Aliicoccus persicus]SEW15958.1 TRAP transporter, 4TM/12TM fusion protein [Aliicoccus persicus]
MSDKDKNNDRQKEEEKNLNQDTEKESKQISENNKETSTDNDNNPTADGGSSYKGVEFIDDDEQQRIINELEGSDRNPTKFYAILITVVASFLSLFHLYVAGFGLPNIGSRTFLIIHLTIGLMLAFMIFPIRKGLNQKSIPWYDLIITGLVLFIGWYLIDRQLAPEVLAGRITQLDLIVGAVFIVLVVEATRRVVGLPLVIIASIAVGYFFLGEYLPGDFYHNRADFTRFVNEMTWRSTGIFGTPIYASAQFVFIFILFGSILESTGAGKMFIDLAIRLVGGMKGGPAKAGIVASGMMGSISGSSTANAVTTGTFTIPLMKRVGFRPETAGGIEVAASSGGQFLPPVMGAAAFIMVEMTGIPYYEIIQAAAIPALLTYFGILFMVHFEALKYGIDGIPKSETVSARKLLIRQGFLIFPILVLLYFLVVERASVNASGFYSITVMIVIAFLTYRFRKNFARTAIWGAILLALAFSMQYIVVYINQGLMALNDVFGARIFVGEIVRWRDPILTMVIGGVLVSMIFAIFMIVTKQQAPEEDFKMKDLIGGFETAARNSLSIITACATAGIIIGVITTTGLGTRFSRIIFNFSETVEGALPQFLVFESTQLYIALILALFACLLLGLGLPTTATYVVLASVIAPALTDLGVPVIVAHLFVLYYGVLADDTPPVNLPAYATAGIARSGPIRTGIQGFKYDSAALLLPFMFAVNPAMLLIVEDASTFDVITAILSAMAGMFMFAGFIQNYMFEKFGWIERIFAPVAAILFIHSSFATDITALALFFIVIFIQIMKRRKKNREKKLESNSATPQNA